VPVNEKKEKRKKSYHSDSWWYLVPAKAGGGGSHKVTHRSRGGGIKHGAWNTPVFFFGTNEEKFARIVPSAKKLSSFQSAFHFQAYCN